MAREWEESSERRFDDLDTWYSRENRTIEARRARQFRVEDLQDFDSRSGTNRMYMQAQKAAYVREHYRVRNTFEGMF